MSNEQNTADEEHTNIHGAIAERPRRPAEYPLLAAIYDRHDRLISQYSHGRVLEVAHGQHAHPTTDIAVDIYPENSQAVACDALVGDARELPLGDNSVDTVIGRRFLHHVSGSDRGRLLAEFQRVLRSDGRLVILEGTPGLYRQIVKRVGFALGVLGDDSDEYGHINSNELKGLINGAGFDVIADRRLGSPLMPLAILQFELAQKTAPWIDSTQWVQWWTFVVSKTGNDQKHP